MILEENLQVERSRQPSKSRRHFDSLVAEFDCGQAQLLSDSVARVEAEAKLTREPHGDGVGQCFPGGYREDVLRSTVPR